MAHKQKKTKPSEERDYVNEYSQLFPTTTKATQDQQWRQEGDIIEEFSLLDEHVTTTTSSSILIE